MSNKDLKIVKGKIVTGGRTIPQVANQFEEQRLTLHELENLRKAYDHFDGAVAVFRLWAYSNFDSFYPYAWEDQYDEQFMMGMYHSEQVNPFQDQYRDNLEGFIADWKAGEYDPMAAFSLNSDDVEVIEVLKEAGGAEA